MPDVAADNESDEYHGRAVDNGAVRFFSVSALEKADTRSRGCMRAYFYRYVMRIRELESESIKSGKALHNELAAYLRTGIRHLSALALSGMHIIPDVPPFEDLIVEASIGSVEHPIVTAAGVPLIGKLDCGHDRGVNKGGSEITEIYDPPGTIEVIDWKWKRDASKVEYQLQPNELVRQIQMAGYAQYVIKIRPTTSYVRLSHGMFFERGARPRKVTKLHVIDEPLRSWEYVEGLARTIKDVVRETDPDRVDANIHACGKYGGCQHRSYCTAYKRAFVDQTTATLFGETLAKELRMGLMQNVPGGQIPLQQMMQTPPTGVAVQPGQPVAQIDLQAALRAQIAQEEQQLRQQAVQTSAGTPPTFGDAWQIIERGGRGYPALGGNAAIMRASLVGQQLQPGAVLAGAGDLGGIRIDDPAQVIQLGSEMLADERNRAMQQQAAPVQQLQQLQQAPAQQVMHVQHNVQPSAVLPPDAPQSNLQMAAVQIPQAQQFAQYNPQLQQVVQQPPQVAPQNLAQAQQQVQAQQPKPRRRGRPPKDRSADAQPQAQQPAPVQVTNVANFAQQPQQAAPVQLQQFAPTAPPPQFVTSAGQQFVQTVAGTSAPQTDESDDDVSLIVYVDCVPNGAYESLHPWIDNLCNVLCDKFIPKDGLRDIRCAPRDSALGYGGWKGAIYAITREVPPDDGVWFIDTRGNEIAAEFADAMRVVCEARGGTYVRGIR